MGCLLEVENWYWLSASKEMGTFVLQAREVNSANTLDEQGNGFSSRAPEMSVVLLTT